jgi:hypothetical protein
MPGVAICMSGDLVFVDTNAAQLSDCRTLLSEDFQHGREYGSVRVASPFKLAPADTGR